MRNVFWACLIASFVYAPPSFCGKALTIATTAKNTRNVFIFWNKKDYVTLLNIAHFSNTWSHTDAYLLLSQRTIPRAVSKAYAFIRFHVHHYICWSPLLHFTADDPNGECISFTHFFNLCHLFKRNIFTIQLTGQTSFLFNDVKKLKLI